MADARTRLGRPHHRNTWRTDPGRQNHTILPYAGITPVVCATHSLTVTRPAKPFAPMQLASTAARPAFVTIAIRPSSLDRVAATHTSFPNFGKVEYFWVLRLTDILGVLPDGQRKGLWTARPPNWSRSVASVSLSGIGIAADVSEPHRKVRPEADFASRRTWLR